MSLTASLNGTDISAWGIYPGGTFDSWHSAPVSTRSVITLPSRLRNALSRTDDVAARTFTLPIYLATNTLAARQATMDALKALHRQQVTLRIADGTTTRELIGTITAISLTPNVTANNVVARGTLTILAADPLWRATADVATASASVTNLCLQSEALATSPWGLDGDTTVGANAGIAPDGTLTADTIIAGTAGDDNQAITFTGNGTKVISAYVKQGTMATLGFSLYSTTGPVYRRYVDCTWIAGAPTIVGGLGTGTMFAPVAVGNGWYRIAFAADGVIASETNLIILYPGGGPHTSSPGETMYVWGVQAENAATPGPYVKTTTASASAIAIQPALGTGPVEDWTLDVSGWTSNLTVTIGSTACTYTGSLAGGHTLHLNANLATCLDDASNVIANWAGGFPALDPTNWTTAVRLSAAAGTPTGTLTYRPRYY